MTDTKAIAPDFTLPRDGGGEISLASLRASRVVLYFYPRADTSGCTLEAQEFTQNIAAFGAADTVILGVSKDPVAQLDKFRDKYQLQVALLSDAASDVCERYGVWVEKNMYGKKHMGIERATFVIDRNGEILHEWRKVRVPGHVQQVLDAVRVL